MNYLFHGTCGAFALATIFLLVAFRRVRDPGYAVLGSVSLLALALAAALSSWWPLVAAIVLTALFLFMGSGGWYEDG